MSIADRNALILSVIPWTVAQVHARTAGRGDREDVLQDAYLHLLRLAPGYSAARGAPTTWANVVLKSFLARRLTRPAFLGPPPSPNALPVEETRDHRAVDPAAEAERVEDVATVRNVLTQVRPADRQMVEARVLDGERVSYLDANVSREANSQRYRKAVNRCRQAFAAVGLA